MPDAIKLVTKPGVQVVNTNIANVPYEMIDHFQRASHLFIDTETTGLHPWKGAEIALFQMHDRVTGDTLLGRVQEGQMPPEWLCDTFRKGDKTFVGHNLTSFDIQFMDTWGLPWKGTNRYYDTLTIESLVSTSGRRDVSKSLRASVKRRTGQEVNKDMEHGGWRNETLTERQEQYAAIDVLVLPEFMDEQLEKARAANSMEAVEMEIDVAPVFAQMTINGLPVDELDLESYMIQQAQKAAVAEVILRHRLGAVNLKSPVKLRKALADIGIDLPGTSKDVLLDQVQFDPEAENSILLQAILDWRAPNKRTEMYGSPEWQEKHIQPDGRIHARFWQVGADTTRVSSSDPNLQQVPKDGRHIIGGLPGYKIISVDYSQIEVRIAADICMDEVLIEMLDHEDVHSAIASQVFQIPVSAVTAKQRKLAKAAVFTLLFGGGAKRLHEYARRSGSMMTFEEAEDLFYRFFAAFQGLASMRQKAYAMSRNRRVTVITLPNGARRVLFGQKNSPQVILNTPVQGTAAVGMKYGLIEAKKQGLDKYLGAVVHDETVSCAPDNEAEEYGAAMSECLIRGMSRVVTACPVKTEAKIDSRWLP